MGEDITFHVYATLTPAQAARVTRMDFTMDTADSNPNKAQSVPLASATKVGSVYNFAYTGVTPQCMADEITATLYWDDGSVLDTITWSVADYLRTYLDAYPGEADGLIGALAVYGDAARTYMDYRADETALTALIGASCASAAKPAHAQEKQQTASAEDGLKILGTRLHYANVPGVTVRTKVSLGHEGAYIRYRDPNGVTQSVALPTGENEQTYLVSLPVTALNRNYRFELCESDGTVVQTLIYGVPACAYGWWDLDTNPSYTALVKALYTYGVQARAYLDLTDGSSGDIGGEPDPF
ncbi:MAG: hypothetical protein IKN53_00170, partial [Oscillibacter sp.]|nr:hypothetical protein [Oscillibacter sp.]